MTSDDMKACRFVLNLKKKEENKQKHCPSPDSNPEPQAKGKRISALPHLWPTPYPLGHGGSSCR